MKPRERECPQCLAQPGQPCIAGTHRGPMRGYHEARRTGVEARSTMLRKAVRNVVAEALERRVRELEELYEASKAIAAGNTEAVLREANDHAGGLAVALALAESDKGVLKARIASLEAQLASTRSSGARAGRGAEPSEPALDGRGARERALTSRAVARRRWLRRMMRRRRWQRANV